MPTVPRAFVPKRVEDSLDAMLDRALAVQRPMVLAYLERAHARRPGMRPAQLVTQLERRYRMTVVGIGGASGAAAAMPGAGTTASVASGLAEITAFVSASAMYVLALAELHQVPVDDPQIRRALVLSVLLGEGGEALLAGESVAKAHWAHVLGRTGSKDRVAALNGRLGHLLVTRFGVRQGALLVGRALPLGIGASVGAVGNAALATATIRAARRAFGPAPAVFPPRVVNIG